MSKPDGGPAFPVDRVGTDGWHPDGMTLRDWYAGQEMATFHRDLPEGPLGRLWTWLWHGPALSDEECAEECFGMADAMLRERDR